MALDMIDLGQTIYKLSKRIEKGVDKLHQYGVSYAETEKEYRIALAKEIVVLRESKMPVTLVNEIARGNTAELKFKRDLAEMEYKVAKDMLNALQSELSGLQTLYKKQSDI
jgi:hypothetical protein